MSVVIFDVEIKTKQKGSTKSVREEMVTLFEDVSGSLTESTTKWENSGSNISILYSVNDLIGESTSENNQYFLFETKSNKSKDKVTVEILIKSESNNINYSVNSVIKDIKVILNRKKLKMKVLDKNPVHLYPYNRTSNDIWDHNLKIRSSFDTKLRITSAEKIRLFVISVVTVVLVVLWLAGNMSASAILVIRSLALSGLFFIVSDVLSKLPIPKYNLSISDLSNFVEAEEIPFKGSISAEQINSPTI